MYPPDGLLTSGKTKHDVGFDPHIIAPDPIASVAYIDDISQEDLFLLITLEGLNTMNTGEDEPSNGLNGRLRPRKSNHSPQSSQILRKSESKSSPDKTKKTTNLKISPDKTDDLVNKSDNTIARHFCPYCDKTFISKQTALKHVHLIHISSSQEDYFIDCLFCNHVEHNSNIIRHMVDSHPNQYFACLDCHTRFPSTSDVAAHKLNVCEKQKLPYRSKLRQKSLESKIKKPSKPGNTKSLFHDNTEFNEDFNGIVISCELKPTQVHDEADIEDNITTNLILPSNKGISHKAVIEKNAIIVLDDIQWNKRIPSNFSFHNADADQILTRLGVVHRSPRTGETTKKEWQNPAEDETQKFEKCFDTSFYTNVANNVQENLLKYLDGSFNDNPGPDSNIKTRKSKSCIPINTADGFPILLAGEQYSRSLFDGFMPRAVAPKHKWKWDSPDNERAVINADQLKRDSHLNNCIITYVSNLDIWTQLRMRKKYEDKFSSLPLGKKTEKQNIISKELKEILESKEIPTTSTQGIKHSSKPIIERAHFPAILGLTPAPQPYILQPAILSGESVRPRCFVCCACGAQTRDSRTLASHISTQHPNAQVEHYEIVGEHLLNADILKHLYVPPSQIFNRARPLRGIRECTKCKKPITLEELHQHMLDCAGDTPTVRRKCRYRPFGVRKRRPRLPDNRIRRKMRKDIRTGQRNDKNHMRPRPKTRSEVGDAETIRKMLADLPAKRHRVTVNPLNSFPRKKYDRKRNKIMTRKHSLEQKYKNVDQVSNAKISTTRSNADLKDGGFNNDEDDDDDDNLPLKPKIRDTPMKSSHKKEYLNKKSIMNRPKRKPNKEMKLVIENTDGIGGCIESNEPDKISMENSPNRVNFNTDPQKVRGHSNREGSNNNNNREGQQSGSNSGQGGNSHNANAPIQNVPLKHSIASLTADSETQDKSVQFHRLFLVQQECNNVDEQHLPSDRRVLFENEAVVTKLDKPPLHFNQSGTFDHHNSRKNKSSKPRKRLNDCIAMLKNKLTPNSDTDIPGHVSVQCGSDEPIEPEPIFIQGFQVINTKQDNLNEPILLSHISTDKTTFKRSDRHGKSHKSSLIMSCPDKEQLVDLHSKEQLVDLHSKEQLVDLHSKEQLVDLNSKEQLVDLHSKEQLVDLNCKEQLVDSHSKKQLEDLHSNEQLVDLNRKVHLVDSHIEKQLEDLHSKEGLVDLNRKEQLVDSHNKKQLVDLHSKEKLIIERQDKEPIVNIQNNVLTKENDTLIGSEVSPTQIVALPPPRNTVIRKSPKIIGIQMQQEEINMRSYPQRPFNGGGNNCTSKNIIETINNIEEPSKLCNDFSKSIITQEVQNSQFCNGVTNKDALVDLRRNNNLINIKSYNVRPLDLNLRQNAYNRYTSAKRLEVEQDVDFSQKNNLKSSSGHYNDNPVKIPPAHAKASFEPFIPTPLDLSGKTRYDTNTSDRCPGQDRLSLNVNTYDDCETLDLSNKNAIDDNTLQNLTIVEDLPTDVVVDLSFKQTPQSTPTNLSTKVSHNNENRTVQSYESIDENVPTDLSLRKRVRTPSVTMVPKDCAPNEYAQDLSKHKTVEKNNSDDNLVEVDYTNKDAPRDLSNKGPEGNSRVTEIILHETEKVTNSRELNRMSNTFDVTMNPQNVNIGYDNTVEPHIHNSHDEINLNVREHDSNYILQSTTNESINRSHSQNQVSLFSNINSSDLNETIGSTSFVHSNTESNNAEENEAVESQPSQPFIETICFIVPKDQLPYEIENSTLNITITTNGESVPLYQAVNCNETTPEEERRDNVASSTSVYTLEHVSLPLNTSSLVTAPFLNIPEETISSSTSADTELENVRDPNPMYKAAIDPNHVIDLNANENSLILTNGNSQPDTNMVVEHASMHRNVTLNNEYNLRQEVIDCDIEQDTETARKIAMLPKELVEILGTMPTDHRNQLLNVLPQYVSTNAIAAAAETRKCLIKKSSSSTKTQSSTPETLPRERSYENKLYGMKKINQAIGSNAALYPVSTIISSESLPQSVILKTPILLNEGYQTTKISEQEYSPRISIEQNQSTPIQKPQTKLFSPGGLTNVVIDLTDDENIHELQEDIQIVEGDTAPLNHDFDQNQNLETSLELLRQKGNSDQTASLRAVRIKTPSERNKQLTSEYSLEFKNFHKNINDSDKIIDIVGYTDMHTGNSEIKSLNEDLVNATNTAEMPLLQCINSNKSFITLNENKIDKTSINTNENILVNSSVILTPISNKECSIVISDSKFDKIKYSQSDLLNSTDEDIILLDTSDACENNTPILLNEDFRFSAAKDFTENPKDTDEDSEDDVTLAVIVKKKRQQCQLSSYTNKVMLVDEKHMENILKSNKTPTKSDNLQYTSNEQSPSKQQNACEKVIMTVDNNNDSKLINSILENRIKEHQKNDYIFSTSNTSSTIMEVKNSNFKRMTRNRRDSPNLSKTIDRRKINFSSNAHKKEQDNMLIRTKDYQKIYNKDTVSIQTVVNDASFKADNREDCSDQINNIQSNTDVKENQSSNKNYDSLSNDKAKLNANLPQISQQSSKENIQKSKDECGIPEKKKCIVRNCILHSYMGDLYRRSLYNSKQTLAPHLKAICTGVPISVSKIKKMARVKEQRNKECLDIRKPQQISFEIEDNNPSPLRRSRRGKSMFVDNNSAVSYDSKQNDKQPEQKVPLTKKQLIFSKLLLDGERMTQTKLDEVIVKEPVVLIKDVSLSGHILSSVSQNNKNTKEPQQSIVHSLKEDKKCKRKKSPQTKQKYKKIKYPDDFVDKTLRTTPSSNTKDLKNNNKHPTKETTSYRNQKGLSPLLTDSNKNNVESNIYQITNQDNSNGNAIQVKSTEKRKICCTQTSADVNHDSITKKSKLINHTEIEIKKHDDDKRSIVENCRKSRPRNSDVETKNKTCYNSVAVRRTRSKSVVVKSSAPLYDPYDIDLEDMAEGEASLASRLTNKAFSKSFRRDVEVKMKNKIETSVGVNTEPIIEENKNLTPAIKVKYDYSKEDVSDSDDSSKSDVPLQKYVKEKEKKKLKSKQNISANASKLIKNDSKKEKSKKKIDTQSVASTSNEQQNKADQFMESFGFFSERKPRKSNLIAAKKIAETFSAIEADDTNDDDTDKIQTTTKQNSDTSKPNTDESTSAEPPQSPTKKPAKRGRKKGSTTKPIPTFCVICNKEFKRPDNYLRHQITLLHISKLSEIEMKVKTIPVFEEPNYLVPYKQQLDRLKMLSLSKKKKNVKPPPKTVLNLGEILANVNRSVREQQLSRRNLSRDEALFIDCCELLKESHKPDASNNTEQVTTIITTTTEQVPAATGSNNTQETTSTAVTNETEQATTISNNNEQAVIPQSNEQATTPALNDVNTIITVQTPVNEITNEIKTNSEEYESRSDGDVDSITAKNILESEEVRNLENDLLTGLKEAAAQSLASGSGNFVFQQTLSTITFTQNETEPAQDQAPNPVLPETNRETIECTEEVVLEPPKKISKPKGKQKVKVNMYPDIIENIDMFEDKFDKIKRKCRSQAAAAKQVKPIIEPITSQKGRKKSENNTGKNVSTNNAIPTKGALKGFDGLKVPPADNNVSNIVPVLEKLSKGKSKSNPKKGKDRLEVETKIKSNLDHSVKSAEVDVYEFMDSEDTELFDFRPSTLMERFKNINNRDMPSTSKFVPAAEEIQFSSESGSDGDDFVYDDYVCSDDETENSLMSCEIGNGKAGTDTKSKSNSPLKRKDVIEKNAVMGKIFKHNAVRTEKKSCKNKDQERPQANLDQLFDSLFEHKPAPPTLSTKLPKKESKGRESTSLKKHVSRSYKKHEPSKRHESSKKHKSPKKPETSKKHDSPKKRELSKKHESSKKNESSKKLESSKKYECSKKHESSHKHDSSYKYESAKKYESSKHEFSKTHDSSKKRDSSKKHVSHKEHSSKYHRKHQSGTDYEKAFPRKHEAASSSKHDTKMSKQHSGKGYTSTSCDNINKDGPCHDIAFDCKPSTSKDYSYELIQETVKSTPRKHYSDKYIKSSSNEYHSLTSKTSNLEDRRSGRESFHPCSNLYNITARVERHSREMTSKRDLKLKNKRHCGPSDLYNNPFRRFRRDRSTTPEIDEDNDSNSDIMLDTLDEATSDKAGVARQRARRKCTVGKQNILAETWSSESEPEIGPPRPNSAESESSGGGRKKGRKKREPLYGIRRGVSRQMPILRQDLESRVALFKRTTSSSGSAGSGGIQGSSSGAGPSTAPCTLAVIPSSSVPNTTGAKAGPSGSKQRPRTSANVWPAEGEEDQEHHQQHGWIVGVSHKKLVTMLAHAKGRRRHHDDKRHYVE